MNPHIGKSSTQPKDTTLSWTAKEEQIQIVFEKNHRIIPHSWPTLLCKMIHVTFSWLLLRFYNNLISDSDCICAEFHHWARWLISCSTKASGVKKLLRRSGGSLYLRSTPNNSSSLSQFVVDWLNQQWLFFLFWFVRIYNYQKKTHQREVFFLYKQSKDS